MANYFYNKVELPDINEVWTDKTTYPYAVLCAYTLENQTIQQLFPLPSYEFSFTGNSPSLGENTIYLKNDTITTYFEKYDYENQWHARTSTPPIDAIATVSELIWVSHDLIIDGTAYFTASDPVLVPDYVIMPGQDYKAACDAIRAKTGKTDLIKSGNMATEIEEIKTGGGGVSSVPLKGVNFYDYDGTLLHSYTVEEAQALTELPELPTRNGLICQGWNYDLATVKAYNRAVDVGATYITDDGKTRLYIKITAEGRMDVPLYFSQTVANGVTIDWGDGSATETLSGTGNKNTVHTYASIGDYVISLGVVDGCTLGFGNGMSSYCVLGATSTGGRVYCNMLKMVEVGDGVTSIGNSAFNYCYSLVSIAIPDGVTNISSSAFYNCYSLLSIAIPDGVTSISDNAFRTCYSLASISIPDGVTSIGNTAFYNCSSLASITIPDGVTSIGNTAFYNCNSLASITIPDGVTNISSSAFGYCYSLSSIAIPDGVTSIGNGAFRACYSLASITIPDGVTSISDNAFGECYSLVSISIPDGVTNIVSYAFSLCYGMKFYDFTSHIAVPTLENTNAFANIPSDCEIRVPAALYDEWLAATNWSTYADKIVAV